jgi:hypothetical protein
MKMKKRSIFLFLVSLMFLSSCSSVPSEFIRGSGNVGTETRQLEPFHGVELNLPGDMEITLGDKESITIQAEDNLLPLIQTNVTGGILKVGLAPGTSINPTKALRFQLTAKALDALTTNSTGSINSPALSAEQFKASINSSGNIELVGLSAKSIQVVIESNGNVKINQGEVADQNIKISSSGNYNTPDLKSKTAKVTIDSSGDALIWVTDSLDVVINSSGSVKYYGNPAVKTQINSSGSVQPMGEK